MAGPAPSSCLSHFTQWTGRHRGWVRLRVEHPQQNLCRPCRSPPQGHADPPRSPTGMNPASGVFSRRPTARRSATDRRASSASACSMGSRRGQGLDPRRPRRSGRLRLRGVEAPDVTVRRPQQILKQERQHAPELRCEGRDRRGLRAARQDRRGPSRVPKLEHVFMEGSARGDSMWR